MNANLLDRRQLAALVFKDESLLTVGTRKFEQKYALLHASNEPVREVHTLYNVVETFCRVYNDLEQLNPLGIVEYQYMPVYPPSRHVYRYYSAQYWVERNGRDTLKLAKNRGKVTIGEAYSYERVYRCGSCVLKPKTAQLPRQKFRQMKESAFVTECSDPPDYGENPLHCGEDITALLSYNAMRMRPSAGVRRMRIQYRNYAEVQANLPLATPDVLLYNAMPTRSRAPSRCASNTSTQTSRPVSLYKQRSISPNSRKVLEQQLYTKSKKVEAEMLARVQFRHAQNTRRVGETKAALRQYKYRILDEINSIQKNLQRAMADARTDYYTIQYRYLEILQYSRAARPVYIAPEFYENLIYQYSDFSALSAFWYTRGNCGCLACMSFLGLDSDSVGYSINYFLADAREEEELNKIRENIMMQARQAEAQFFKRGLEIGSVKTENPYPAPQRRPSSANGAISDSRYIVVPCGCSICYQCAIQQRYQGKSTCPVCYQEAQQIVRVKSVNQRFGPQLTEQIGYVLFGLRGVCRCISELVAIDFAACEGNFAE